MNRTRKLSHVPVVILLLSSLMAGCNDTPQQSNQSSLSSMHIMQGDECHLCGMLIKGFPGPKGAIQVNANNALRKFCSSNDLLAFLLQPENAQYKHLAYVHDMANAMWDTPDDTAFILVEDAWYVINHAKPGAMGPTLATFSTQVSAEHFAAQHQGQIIRFNDISLDLLGSLSLRMHEMHSHHH